MNYYNYMNTYNRYMSYKSIFNRKTMFLNFVYNQLQELLSSPCIYICTCQCTYLYTYRVLDKTINTF